MVFHSARFVPPVAKRLGLAAFAAAVLATTGFAAESGSLASGTITIYHNTGDPLVEGLPATKTVNLAGDTVTTLATCSGQVRKQITGSAGGSPAPIVVTQTFDATGNLLSRRDATGAGTDFTYDELSRKTTETDAQVAGKTRAYTYDAANRLITVTDPLGVVTTYGYDLRDRKISESTPMNGTETRLIQYGYDAVGHMTSLTDANGAVTTWGYDNAGRQISKTYANGDHRTMEYDAASRLVKLTDENGHDITSVYDLAGRLTAKHFTADNTDDTFVYDAASRMTSATKGRYNHTQTYTYDQVGRLATETHPDGTVLHLAYDSVNRLANLALGAQLPSTADYSVNYAFDNRGLLSTVTSGDYATSYTYRANGQLSSTIDSRVNTPQGDVLRADRFYDAGARLTQIANTAANGDQAGVTYTLTADDQRVEAVEESGQKWNYGYDSLKQLVTARKTDTAATVVAPLDQSYTYDPMGNRRAYADQAGSTAYVANNANQYTTVGGLSSVYDKNGNLLSDGVKNYVWDAENQLMAITPVSPVEGSQKVEYAYDWRMRRTAKKSYTYTSGAWVPTKTTGFKYHEWNPIEETIVNASTSATQVKNYTWGNDLSGNLHGAGGVGGLISMKYNGDSYFYAFDGNGNVRALVKADAANPAASAITARYAYDGFGKEVAVSGADAGLNAFRFSTKQVDVETDMNYYGYRYYAATLGRWINRDPIEEDGGLNIYSMLLNDSISNLDFLGNASIGIEQVFGDPVNYNGGGFKHVIKWVVSPDAGPKGGQVLQHVSVAMSVDNCKGEALKVFFNDYYEAWWVKPNSKTIFGDGKDTMRVYNALIQHGLPSGIDGTRGMFEMVGVASYYPNVSKSATANWKKDASKGWADDLPSLDHDPRWPVVDASSDFTRKYITSWDCCCVPKGQCKARLHVNINGELFEVL